MKTSKKKTILITGSGGMVGSLFVKFFASKGYSIIGLYNEQEHAVDTEHTSGIVYADISSRVSVNKIKKKFKHIDCIIHCAGMTNVNECEENKKGCRLANIEGTRHMTELAKSYDAQIIFFSTPMVFSGTRGNYHEIDKTSPINFYGKTKVAGENIILKYEKGLVLRMNPIGVRPTGAHPSFVQWFYEAAKNDKSFTLFSDVWINPISTQTLAGVIEELIKSSGTGILHVGSLDRVNKADIWKIIVAKFSKFSGKVSKAPVEKTKTASIARRPKEMWLNVDNIQKTYGITMPQWQKEIVIVLNQLSKL
ncbi:MAG: SDR family oxidoreductase [Parcubacteria group bacterium]